jgi:CRISPR-associated protein Cmr4
MSAITPIHNGAGEGLGIVDRPIIRERATNFPIIQSSSIKGTMRDEYKFKTLKDEETDTLFGPFEDGSKHAGCVSFGDANIFAFPVRSLKGCFVWATSPLILYRFRRMLEVASIKMGKLDALIEKLHSKVDSVWINPEAKNALLIKDKIILEEFPRIIEEHSRLKEFCAEVATIIFKEKVFQQEFIKKLAILPENDFRYFVTNATEVVPNIRIKDETGTTKEGSLRYTEYLPSETVLYSLLSFEKSYSPSFKVNESEVKNLFISNISNKPNIIQLGGDNTKGKGFVQLGFLEGKNG